jgi:hypothetical protein
MLEFYPGALLAFDEEWPVAVPHRLGEILRYGKKELDFCNTRMLGRAQRRVVKAE